MVEVSLKLARLEILVWLFLFMEVLKMSLQIEGDEKTSKLELVFLRLVQFIWDHAIGVICLSATLKITFAWYAPIIAVLTISYLVHIGTRNYIELIK